MYIKCIAGASQAWLRVHSTVILKYSTQPINVSKRNEYYKNLGEKINESRQAGWDEALPYEAIPGPKPLPLLGNSWRFFPVIGEFYKMPLVPMHKLLRDTYGDIVALKNVMGNKPLVFLYNTDDIENLLRNSGPFPIRHVLSSFVYYRTVVRKDLFKEFSGLLSVQGEEWFKFRTLVNPILMQPRTVLQYVSKMEDIAGQLVDNMKYFATQNKNNEMPENFLNELYKWAFESVGVVALNKRLGCLNLSTDANSDIQKLISSLLEMFEMLYLLEVLPPVWKIITTPGYRKLTKKLDFITDFMFKHIDDALAQPIDESVPEHEQSVLLRLAKEHKEIARAMVTDMLMAGIDTTGKTMGATLYFLARNPEKQAILRKELMNNLPEKSSPITGDVLSKSPYLKAVIKETNRISPVALGTLRTTVKDMVLGGYKVPKNSEVLTASILTSNSEREFKDPEKFIPERWLRTNEDEYSSKNVHPFAYMPFGYGPRSCVGKRFANLELEVGVAKIIRNLQLTWRYPDMRFSSNLLYGIADPLKLTVKPIDK